MYLRNFKHKALNCSWNCSSPSVSVAQAVCLEVPCQSASWTQRSSVLSNSGGSIQANSMSDDLTIPRFHSRTLPKCELFTTFWEPVFFNRERFVVNPEQQKIVDFWAVLYRYDYSSLVWRMVGQVYDHLWQLQFILENMKNLRSYKFSCKARERKKSLTLFHCNFG